MRLGFKVVGDQDITRAFQRMPESLAGKRLARAAVLGSFKIKNAWKQEVRERAFKTGTYMRSIQSKVLSKNKDRVEVAVGTDIVKPPYPFFLEYGTSKMAPRACMRNAYDASKDEAAREIEDVLLLEAEKEWRR